MTTSRIWRGVRMRETEGGADPDAPPRPLSLPAAWDDQAASALAALAPGDGRASLPRAADAWIRPIAAQARETGDCALADRLHALLLRRQAAPHGAGLARRRRRPARLRAQPAGLHRRRDRVRHPRLRGSDPSRGHGAAPGRPCRARLRDRPDRPRRPPGSRRPRIRQPRRPRCRQVPRRLAARNRRPRHRRQPAGSAFKARGLAGAPLPPARCRAWPKQRRRRGSLPSPAPPGGQVPRSCRPGRPTRCSARRRPGSRPRSRR